VDEIVELELIDLTSVKPGEAFARAQGVRGVAAGDTRR
jgi:hypothetical protein